MIHWSHLTVTSIVCFHHHHHRHHLPFETFMLPVLEMNGTVCLLWFFWVVEINIQSVRCPSICFFCLLHPLACAPHTWHLSFFQKHSHHRTFQYKIYVRASKTTLGNLQNDTTRYNTIRHDTTPQEASLLFCGFFLGVWNHTKKNRKARQREAG